MSPRINFRRPTASAAGRVPGRWTNRACSLVVLMVVTVAVAASCSTDASTRTAAAADEKAPTAKAVATLEPVPAGTTLRVGDQVEYLQTLLSLSGQDKDFPYTVEYSSFIGGPPMLQAFQGGALDTGFVGSTPLIFAQAARQNIVAIAAWASENGTQALVTTDPDIEGWDDLAGKRVAYQRGTAAEAGLLQALDREGIDPSEVTAVDVPITQIAAALKGGSADAGISVEPLITKYLTETPGARTAAQASEVTDRTNFLIATREALDDRARSAALADYTARVVRGFTYLAAHPELLAESFYVKQYGLTPERAAQVQKAAGTTSVVLVPGDVVDQQQRLADLFAAAGQIPAKIDVDSEFDSRFNEIVRQARDS